MNVDKSKRLLGSDMWAARLCDIESAPVDRPMQPITIDTRKVPNRGDPLHPILWRGKQWAVTEYGMECLDGLYFIEADRLVESHPLHSWPEHMATKGWVDRADFLTAWMVALVLLRDRIPADQHDGLDTGMIEAAIKRSSRRWVYKEEME